MSELTVLTDASSAADREIDRLRANVVLRRHRVVASMGELRRRVDGVVSWRHWIRARPVVAIAVALSLGFIVGHAGSTRDRARDSRD